MVGTTDKSIAAMSRAWLRRRSAIPARRAPPSTMYWVTLDCATENPSSSVAVNAWCAPSGSSTPSAGSIRAARVDLRSPSDGRDFERQ